MKTARTYPQIPDKLAVAYVTVTMLIMAYSFLFRLVPILIFLAIWLAHIFYKKTFILRPSADLAFALAFPFLCTYSALWSDHVGPTFYAGAALFSMIACTVIIARTVRAEAFVKGVALGTLLTLVVTLMNGNYATDYFSTTAALVGLFGSKNEVGFFAEVGIYTSLLILFSKMSIRDKIVFALVPLATSIACLYMSKSASSVISLTVALGVGSGVYLLTRLPRPLRALAIGMGIFALLTAATAVAATNVNVFDPILKSFGKDSTLTGRTYLWSEGIKNGMKHPVLGYGYYAFWQPGRPEAERYWKEFEIDSRTGFHFHNLFIQVFVDFGVTGLALILLIILTSCWKSVRLSLKEGPGLETGFALGMSFLFLVRAFVEVDLFGPFGIGPFLYFSIIPRLARNAKDAP